MGKLDTDAVAAYHREGYIICRGLFSLSEVQEVADETAVFLERKELMVQNNIRVRWQYHYETMEPVFELFDPVTDIAPKCDVWFRGRQIAEILELGLRFGNAGSCRRHAKTA